MKKSKEIPNSYSTWFWLIGIFLFLIVLAKVIPVLQNYLASTETEKLLLPFQNEYFSWRAYLNTDSYTFINTPLVGANSVWRLFFALIIWLVLMTLIYIPFSIFKNNKIADSVFRSIVSLLFFAILLAVYFLPLRETTIDETSKVILVREQFFKDVKKIKFSDAKEFRLETKRTSTADENYYLITLEVYILEKNGTQTKLGERPLQEIDIRKSNERELYRREPASKKMLEYIRKTEIELNKILIL